MKTRAALVPAFFALATAPLWAQQPSPATQQGSPTTTQRPAQQSPAQQSPAEQAPQSPAEATPAAPAAAMSPISGELISTLDSKTAKTGDAVVIQTKTAAKTADGTDIPKGSKLMGHVIAVQPSQGGTNSQVALKFDHLELNGGQSVAIQSQIQSITPAGGAEPAGGSTTASPSAPAPGGGSTAASSSTGATGTAGSRSMSGTSSAPQTANSPAPAEGGMPAAGTVVARSGQIAVQTTAVPGVLLANNAPGQQDPRMAQVSSILLGARKDIQLDGGTQMVINVAAVSAGTR